MATNYTGNPAATQAPSPAPAQDAEPIVVLPDDGDAANAASIAQAFKTLADFTAWITNNAAFKAATRTITAIWTFTAKLVVNGASGDTNPALETTDVPTAFKYLWGVAIGGGEYLRLYSHPTYGWWFTKNAIYTANVGAEWARDVAGNSGVVAVGGGTIFTLIYSGGSASPWATAAWGTPTTALGTTGYISAVEDITTTAGNLETQGDPASGKGLVKFKHLSASGSAPGAVAGAAAGDDGGGPPVPPTPTITGNDARGTVSVTTGAANVATGDLLVITYNKAYAGGTTPVPVISPNVTLAPALLPYVKSYTNTGFTIAVDVAPATSTSYGFTYQVIG